MNVGIGQALMNGKTGAEKTGGQSFNFGDTDFFAVECGAFTARGRVELVVNRIVDDAREDRVFVREGDGDAEAGIAVGKVRGAVKRIDVPAEFGGPFVASAFLGGDGMVGKVLRETLDDGLFGSLVGLRHEVDIALVSNMRGAVEL